jgi:hypothetical protein
LEGRLVPDLIRDPGTDFDTDSVPKLIPIGTDIDTVPVPILGHLNKLNISKQRDTPTHKIFDKNKKIQEAINDMAGVPNLGHGDLAGSLNQQLQIPTQSEVETFFDENNYPNSEAKKFYSHYMALGWKIQGKAPIQDWRSLITKWMENARRWPDQTSLTSKKEEGNKANSDRNIQYLYDSFLEGKKIFNQILPEHFDQLKLQLTEETMQQAWQERINEVSGTNQYSLSQLWQAYLAGNTEDPLLQKDKPNLIALAKRIAVIKHFQELKQSSKTNLK